MPATRKRTQPRHRFPAQARLTPEEFTRARKWFPRGSTVFTVLRHVSASGMSRTIGIVIPTGRGRTRDFLHPNYIVAKALGRSLDRDRDGIKVSGCGMDMGFELVYSLAQALYGFENGVVLKHRWI